MNTQQLGDSTEILNSFSAGKTRKDAVAFAQRAQDETVERGTAAVRNIEVSRRGHTTSSPLVIAAYTDHESLAQISASIFKTRVSMVNFSRAFCERAVKLAFF